MPKHKEGGGEESQSKMAPTSKKHGSTAGTNIKVVVRCRPRNKQEKAQCSPSIIECGPSEKLTISGQAHTSKTFNFDKVYGPGASQVQLYTETVKPVLDEVLSGYNCTIFAYGQTGTGKTYTMEGDRVPGTSWDCDNGMGIIPRTLHHLFQLLEARSTEFAVRASFLELYNEELRDLLADDDSAVRLRLYEDSSRKGSVIIQGLEEKLVNDRNQVYDIMHAGALKRQTAATQMNENSSRSHTIFSVTVHIKESSAEGDDTIKIGKLNLVDLAGSENVGRSGAVSARAREAGNINQSLLTLGRVIKSLVERSAHVPYRESKLTRLLQDSLGGRTKTCIIATISPAACNHEETMSTLDYASRAKCITNRPEVNQKLTKRALIKDYTRKIEALKLELQSQRDKNGVYLPHDTYADMERRLKNQRENLAEIQANADGVKENLERYKTMFDETSTKLGAREQELCTSQERLAEAEETLGELNEALRVSERSLENTEKALASTAESLQITVQDRDEQQHLVHTHVSVEKMLHEEAETLLETTQVALTHVEGLHDKLERVRDTEHSNKHTSDDFAEAFEVSVNTATQVFANATQQHIVQIEESSAQLNKLAADQAVRMTKTKELLSEVAEEALEKGLRGALDHLATNMKGVKEDVCGVESEMASQSLGRREMATALRAGMAVSVENLQAQLTKSLEATMEWSQTMHALANASIEEAQRAAASNADALSALVGLATGEAAKAVARVGELEREVGRLRAEAEAKRGDMAQKFMAGVEGLLADLTRESASDTDTIVATVKDHTAVTTSHLAAVDAELLAAGRAAKEGIEVSQAAVVASTVKAKESLDAQMNTAREDVSQGLDGTRELGECCADYVARQVGADETDTAHIKALLAETTQAMEAAVQMHVDAVEKTQCKGKQAAESASTSVADSGKEMHEAVASLTGGLAMRQQLMEDDTATFVAQARGFSIQVNEYFTDTYQHVQPTGMTPRKQSWSVDRNLSCTDPHEDIIRRFNETRKNPPLFAIPGEDGASSGGSETGSVVDDSRSDVADEGMSSAAEDTRDMVGDSPQDDGTDEDTETPGKENGAVEVGAPVDTVGTQCGIPRMARRGGGKRLPLRQQSKGSLENIENVPSRMNA